MKEFLSRTGLPYSVRVVDEDEHAFNDLIALGYRSVPLTVIGTQIVKGFDPDALTKAIAAAD